MAGVPRKISLEKGNLATSHTRCVLGRIGRPARKKSCRSGRRSQLQNARTCWLREPARRKPRGLVPHLRKQTCCTSSFPTKLRAHRHTEAGRRLDKGSS